WPKAVGKGCQAAKTRGNQRFNFSAQQPGKYRRRTAGTDSDLHRRAVDNGRKDDRTKFWTINHIYGDMALLSQRGHLLVDRFVISRGYNQGNIIDVGSNKLALMDADDTLNF